MEVDASTTSVGAVHSQQQRTPPKLHPYAYFSSKFNPAERNYISNCELLAIKLALEELRRWLEGAKHLFTVWTDHKNLQYLHDAKHLNPHQSCWPLFFTIFDFKIAYHPGSKNERADAWSFFTHSMRTSNIQYLSLIPVSLSVLSSGIPRKSKPVPLRILWQVTHQIVSTFHTTNVRNSFKMLIPLLVLANQTLSLLQDRFCWPNIAHDVRRFLSGCTDCAILKTPCHIPSGKLLPLSVSNRP